MKPVLPIVLAKVPPITPFDITFGMWGGQNPGADPFGGSTRPEYLIIRDDQGIEGEIADRKAIIEKNLRGIADLNKKMVAKAIARGAKFPQSYRITGISFHDEDVFPADASDEQILEIIQWLKALLKELDLKVQCYTTNLFSHPAFRSGAFTSPLGGVRDAAMVKSFRGIKVAVELEAKNIIIWGGREGTEFYEQDIVLALHRFMINAKIVIDYAFSVGYKGTFTFEPKQWEPRFQLFAGSEGVFSALIRQYFADEKYRGRIGVNPELPQHVAMSGLSPVVAASNMLLLEDMISVLHYGGQPAGRMDADFAPGLGGNIFEDFHTFLLLHLHSDRWGKVIELDCRPCRTTTTFEGMLRFLEWSILFIRSIEDKVRIYVRDPVIGKIQAEQMASVSQAEIDLAEGGHVHLDPGSIARRLLENAQPLSAVAAIPTDSNEAHAYRTLQIVMGQQDSGISLFDDTPWAVAS